jgi:hypothetical protein
VDDGYGYVGWYPLAPPFFWFGGFAVGYGFAIGPRWSYCPHGEIFSPGLGGRVVAGPSVNAVAARVHPIGGAADGLGHGPEPSRLGFASSQIPHASGASAAGLARAQQFSRPSTATTLGGHAATHESSMSSAGAFGRGSLTGAGMHPALPTTQPGAGKRRPPVGTTAPRVGGGYRGGFRGGFHGGGGGGFHGGGGGGGHGGHR